MLSPIALLSVREFIAEILITAMINLNFEFPPKISGPTIGVNLIFAAVQQCSEAQYSTATTNIEAQSIGGNLKF